MKTGVYSLLFAINFLYESGSLPPVNGLLGSPIGSEPSTTLALAPEVPAVDVPPVPEAPVDPKLQTACVFESFKSSPELLLRTGMLVCHYDQGLGTQLNDEGTLEPILKELKEIVANTLCDLGGVLKTSDTSVGTPTSENVKTLVEFLRPILDESGLSKPHMATLCSSIAPALKTGCLPKLMANDPVKLMLDMKLQACQGRNNLIFQDLIALWKRFGCLLKSSSELPELTLVSGQAVKEPAVYPLLAIKQSLLILMKFPVKQGAGPDVNEPIALPAVPQEPDTTTAAVPTPPLTPDTTAANVPTLPPTPDTTAATVPTLPPTPDTRSTVPDEHLSIVKRDLGEGISTTKLDVIKKGRPKVMVSCTAINRLVKQVTPFKTNTVQKP